MQNVQIPGHGKEKVIIIPRRELLARKQSKIFVAKVLPGSVSPRSCSPNRVLGKKMPLGGKNEGNVES